VSGEWPAPRAYWEGHRRDIDDIIPTAHVTRLISRVFRHSLASTVPISSVVTPNGLIAATAPGLI